MLKSNNATTGIFSVCIAVNMQWQENDKENDGYIVLHTFTAPTSTQIEKVNNHHLLC